MQQDFKENYIRQQRQQAAQRQARLAKIGMGGAVKQQSPLSRSEMPQRPPASQSRPPQRPQPQPNSRAQSVPQPQSRPVQRPVQPAPSQPRTASQPRPVSNSAKASGGVPQHQRRRAQQAVSVKAAAASTADTREFNVSDLTATDADTVAKYSSDNVKTKKIPVITDSGFSKPLAEPESYAGFDRAVTQQFSISEVRMASVNDGDETSSDADSIAIYAPTKKISIPAGSTARASVSRGENYAPTKVIGGSPSSVKVAEDDSDVKIAPSSRPVKAAAPKQVPVRKNEASEVPYGASRPKSQPVKSVSYGGSPAYSSRRRPSPSDDDIFKKELSDSESRAMMFALTGKAESPDDGGDVDIINLGRISAPKKKKEEEKKKRSVGKYIGRFFAAVGAFLLFFVIAVFATVGTIAHGPSETLRDLLVNSAMQASATKWVPYLFLSEDTVSSILDKSEEVVEDKISLDDYNDSVINEDEDEWANAVDGMIFETVNGSTFKAYVLLVKDPSRVFVGTSVDDYDKATSGIDVFQAAKRYGSVACINGGEFLDNGGFGTGFKPMGLTYSEGQCVNDDGSKKTFLGLTYENELIVRESMTKKEADELGIRDAVSFQNGNTLIQKNGDEITVHYQDGNTGTAQRTGIGQRADGTIILVVTDGRSASSLGATHNDMIDLMMSYGAVSAGLVDGGSSSLMYYEDYYNKYDYDFSKLDEYQQKGLVNNYKAFTEPRKIPTFIMVDPLKEGE